MQKCNNTAAVASVAELKRTERTRYLCASCYKDQTLHTLQILKERKLCKKKVSFVGMHNRRTMKRKKKCENVTFMVNFVFEKFLIIPRHRVNLDILQIIKLTILVI